MPALATPNSLGTNWSYARSATMKRDIDAPADEYRQDADRPKRAASAAIDPRIRSLQEKKAKDSKAEVIKIENDLA
jgi:hypothetical protein